MFFVKNHILINTIYNLLLFLTPSKDITTKMAKLHNVKLHKKFFKYLSSWTSHKQIGV